MNKIKKVLLKDEWGTGTLLPIMLGVLVYFLIMWLDKRFSVSLFWGIFAAYILFGGFIYISKSFSGVFENVNIYIGLAILLIGLIGLFIWPEIKLIGWPTIIAGAILALIALLGLLCKRLDDGLSYLDGWGEW